MALLFGQKSERFIASSQEQYLPSLAPDSTEIAQPDPIKVPAHEKKTKSTPTNTISYPEDLPVETVVLDLKEEEKIDASSRKPLVKIGEEVTKRLAIKPSHFFIKQIVRYKYATAGEADLGIKTPELPDTIMNRPACDESFIADVIVKKFCDHLPLNRQSDILTRQKIYVSRQTLSNYVNKYIFNACTFPKIAQCKIIINCIDYRCFTCSRTQNNSKYGNSVQFIFVICEYCFEPNQHIGHYYQKISNNPYLAYSNIICICGKDLFFENSETYRCKNHCIGQI
jgi:transposase